MGEHPQENLILRAQRRGAVLHPGAHASVPPGNLGLGSVAQPSDEYSRRSSSQKEHTARSIGGGTLALVAFTASVTGVALSAASCLA